MSGERELRDEGFLARWSRLKREPAGEPAASSALPQAAPAASPGEAPPLLPNVEDLTIDSDFRGFFHPKVGEDVRRAALRKLFSDPHFNVMDGLDVYIDDYTKADPIPADMLAGLTQAQRIFRWAEGKDEEPETATEASQLQGEEVPALSAIAPDSTAAPVTAASQAQPVTPAKDDTAA